MRAIEGQDPARHLHSPPADTITSNPKGNYCYMTQGYLPIIRAVEEQDPAGPLHSRLADTITSNPKGIAIIGLFKMFRAGFGAFSTFKFKVIEGTN